MVRIEALALARGALPYAARFAEVYSAAKLTKNQEVGTLYDIRSKGRVFQKMAIAPGRVQTHTWGNGIMLAAALQLTAGTGGAPFNELPHDPPWFGPEARDFVLSHPIRPDGNGVIHLTDAPGLGIQVSDGVLAAG